jgi:hypothetical protein
MACLCLSALGCGSSGDDDDGNTAGSGGAVASGGSGGAGAGGSGGAAAAGTGGTSTMASGGSGVAGMSGSGGMTGGTIGTGGSGSGSGGMTAGTGGMTGGSGGGGSTDMATHEPKFSVIFKEIIGNSKVGYCAFGACHGGAPSPADNGGLQLYATDATMTRAALVSKTSTSPMCTGKTYVVPGKPEESLLLEKLKANPSCGMQMPLTPIGHYLDDAQLMQVETWIKNGAMDD